MMPIKNVSLLFTLAFQCAVSFAQLPPLRPGPLPQPTPAQLRWHDTEFYLFFHFGPNTFTNLEWGHGTEAEDLFRPTALDCDQWWRAAAARPDSLLCRLVRPVA